jgi:hypothetical protein
MYFLDITGAFLYVAFRILVFPLVAALQSIFLIVALVQQLKKFRAQLRTIKIKPAVPLYRFVRLRFHFIK